MRNKAKASLWLLLTGVTILTLTCCRTSRETFSGTLVVEKQVCVLKSFMHLPEMFCDLYVAIDNPVDGPKYLTDSITVFFNESLYEFFDNGEDRHLPYSSVYTSDLKHIAEHYREAYRPYFLPDSTMEHEFNMDCLELKLVAQTDTYVTYEVNWIFFGEGEEVAADWVTFAKSDGHRLNSVISNEDMLRFYRENPKYRDENVWSHIQYQLSQGNEVWMGSPTGLLGDSVAHQFQYTTGIYEDLKYPMEAIRPYLSNEAQEMTKQ